jgi:transcriptional regulator with XRE-family HTH domain
MTQFEQLPSGRNAKRSYPRMGLIAARLARNWSQLDVADHLGTTPLSVSRWERGITFPSPFFLSHLVHLFEVTPEQLGLLEGTRDRLLMSTNEVPTIPASNQFPLADPLIPVPKHCPLIGREAIQDALREQLNSLHRGTVCALTGLPGVGKTELAVAVAHDPTIGDWFPDGVLWARLGPNPDLARTLVRWGALLGVSGDCGQTSLEEMAIRIRMAIGQRRLLVILDDACRCEDALVCRVGGPQCSYVLTTRSPVIATHFAADHVTCVPELTEWESMSLLASVAGDVVYAEPEATHELLRSVGGLPLALVLMGRHLRLSALSNQSRRIRDAFVRLSQPEERLFLCEPQAPLDYHASLPDGIPLSLQAVISTSVDSLQDQARAALALLASSFSPSPHCFSEEDALRVGCATELLDELTDAGLLLCMGEDRYAFNPVIGDFGACLSVRRDSRSRVRRNERSPLVLVQTASFQAVS